VAGLGTRFLPATKAQAKEMLPIVDRPLIQYAVEESVAAGCRHIVLISSPSKGSIVDHFRPDRELEQLLLRSNKADLAQEVRNAGESAHVESVLQTEPLGVGHAILQAREAVGDRAFGVMFPDDFILSTVPVMEQLREVHEEHGGIVVAVERVPPEQVHRYGVIAGEQVEEGLVRVTDLVEKPSSEEAPSDLAIVGRYILPPEIFELIEGTAPGAGGEIQITDAMRAALERMPCHAVVFQGTRYDCGSKLGYLQATVDVALAHPRLGRPFRAWLATRTDE
jgi:UTP--glucose-1-phosphate uridylyltransferase